MTSWLYCVLIVLGGVAPRGSRRCNSLLKGDILRPPRCDTITFISIERNSVLPINMAGLSRKILAVLAFWLFIATPFVIQGADLNHNKYPKLANLFFRWDITPAEAKDLAKWDVLIIDMDVQTYSPNSLKLLKQYNPNIKLVAYLASQEIRGDSGTLNGTLRQKLFNRINYQWWLKDGGGNKVAWWPQNPMLNVTSDCPVVNNQRWSDALPWFVKTEIMSTGYWDGVFYDNVWDNISFMSSYSIDLNGDGQAEAVGDLNAKWKSGMETLLSNTRNILGSDALVLGNGGEAFYKYMNGTLYEHFPVKGWADMMKKYRFINDNGYNPALGILNVNVNNNGNQKDYKKMRFGLTSSLLDDGYYSFDNGDQSHRETWWYDEYEAYLGQPAGEAFNIATSSSNFSDGPLRQSFSEAGVWRRDFKNGLVLVNSSGKEQYVDLGGEYEKLNGDQDPSVNDGSFISDLDLAPQDGVILLRPIDKIVNAAFGNGSFARVFNGYGHQSRTGFFAYNDAFKGSTQIIEKDLDNDGLREIIVADATAVKIYNQQKELLDVFFPYGEKYNKGINIAVGDLDNNGTLEIVTGTDKGGGPQIRVFNNQGKLINPGFFAYASNFRGGVNVAVADLNGDGWLEIVAGAGYGGGPHVRVFAPDGRLINPGFFAYDKSFRGGVNVAAGDIDGDGVDEIVTGSGKGGGSQVRVFDRFGKSEGLDFFAFEKTARDGVKVAVTDMDGDGKMEIIATTVNVFTIAGGR